MNKLLALAAIVASVLFLGCATYDVRFGSTEMKKPYPAVRADWDAATYLLVEWSSPLSIFTLIDIPFSFVSDTVCLPYDLATRNKKQE